jgi:hypothetical protein
MLGHQCIARATVAQTAAFAVCGSVLAARWYGVVQIRVCGAEGKLTSRARDSPPAPATEGRPQ